MNDSPKLKLKYNSESIEITSPDSYEELKKIFIDSFKIDEKGQQLFYISYIEEEGDEIGIYSEEDYIDFKKQLKDRDSIIESELIGKIESESKLSDMNLELDNLKNLFSGTMKDISQKDSNNINNFILEKSFEKSLNTGYANNQDNNDDYNIQKPLENFLYDENNKKNISAEEYTKKIKELEKKIENLEKIIKEKDEIINEEKIKNEKLNKKVEILGDYINKKEKEFEEKLNDYNNQNNRIIELEDIINQLKLYCLSPLEKLNSVIYFC